MPAKILLVEDNEMKIEARREDEGPSDRAGGAQPRPARDGVRARPQLATGGE